MTALEYAAVIEHGRVETLGALLGFDYLAESADLDDIFNNAIRDSAENIASTFLN